MLKSTVFYTAASPSWTWRQSPQWRCPSLRWRSSQQRRHQELARLGSHAPHSQNISQRNRTSPSAGVSPRCLLARERKAMPVNLPLVVGNTSPTALAAPVALGMMLQEAARPPRQSWQGWIHRQLTHQNVQMARLWQPWTMIFLSTFQLAIGGSHLWNNNLASTWQWRWLIVVNKQQSLADTPSTVFWVAV